MLLLPGIDPVSKSLLPSSSVKGQPFNRLSYTGAVHASTVGTFLRSNPRQSPRSNSHRFFLELKRGIKTLSVTRHCGDYAAVKTWHLSPAVSPQSQAPWGPGLQMTGALLDRSWTYNILKGPSTSEDHRFYA